LNFEAAKDFDWERTTALPKLLTGAFDGEEPLYLDLRWARAEIDLSGKHPRFADAVARLSAAIAVEILMRPGSGT
jgi:hypothetical protein